MFRGGSAADPALGQCAPDPCQASREARQTNWDRLGSGLRNYPVMEVKLSGDVYAGTFGRGIYQVPAARADPRQAGARTVRDARR